MKWLIEVAVLVAALAVPQLGPLLSAATPVISHVLSEEQTDVMEVLTDGSDITNDTYERCVSSSMPKPGLEKNDSSAEANARTIHCDTYVERESEPPERPDTESSGTNTATAFGAYALARWTLYAKANRGPGFRRRTIPDASDAPRSKENS